MITTAGNTNQFLIANAGCRGLKSGETIASSQQASEKKLDSKTLNKHMGETHKLFKGKDNEFTPLSEEKDTNSAKTSGEEKSSQKEIAYEPPPCTDEIIILPQHPKPPFVTIKEIEKELADLSPEEKSLLANRRISSSIQEAQDSFKDLKEAVHEYLSISKITGTKGENKYTALWMFDEIASMYKQEQREEAKKDIAYIYKKLGPGKTDTLADIFRETIEEDRPENRQMVADCAIEHLKADQKNGRNNFRFSKNRRHPDTSIKEASDTYLTMLDLIKPQNTGDLYDLQDIYLKMSFPSNKSTAEERAIVKNDALNILKRLERDRAGDGKRILEEVSKISDQKERENEIKIATNIINVTEREEHFGGFYSYMLLKKYKKPDQSLQEASNDFLKCFSETGHTEKARDKYMKALGIEGLIFYGDSF